MRVRVLFILICAGLSAFGAQDSKNCSSENLEKLVAKAAAFGGSLGVEHAEIVKLFTDSDYSKSSPEVLKKRFFEIIKKSNKNTAIIADEIQALVKEHPECDKDHNFNLSR